MTPVVIYSVVETFLDRLPPELKSRTYKQITLLRTFGRHLPPPDSKKLTRNLFELRVRGKVQVRLLYGFSGEAAVILHGFTKKADKVPPREIKLAERRFSALAQQ